MPLSSSDSHLIAALAGSAGRRLAVLGDVILDRYVWGDVDRISPEAPVPVVCEKRVTEVLGGAANVARNLVAAGAKVEIIGAIGRDAGGRRVKELLARLGVFRRGLATDPRRPTTVKTRFLNRGQQLMRFDQEQTGPYAVKTEARLIQSLSVAIARADALIISDYGKGIVSAEMMREAIRMARNRGIPIVADPKTADPRHYRGVDYLTPNLKEAARAAGHALETTDEVVAAGRSMLRQFKGRGVAITRGRDGVSLISPGGPVHIAARAREVFDVTGAGDTFISYFTLSLAAGIAPADSARIGNAAAGIAVSKLGAATVTRDELAAALGGPGSLSKVHSVDGLRLVLDNLREQGRKIVLTNGCFDLFHAGHVRLLHEASALGDVVVVALNSDRSVRRIKGKPRPILPEAERAAVLSALAVVDYVVFFDEDTPERLLEALRPDVLVKGRQKGRAPVIGADLVRSHGGRVVELDLVDVSSTGELVRKIRRSGRVPSKRKG